MGQIVISSLCLPPVAFLQIAEVAISQDWIRVTAPLNHSNDGASSRVIISMSYSVYFTFAKLCISSWIEIPKTNLLSAGRFLDNFDAGKPFLSIISGTFRLMAWVYIWRSRGRFTVWELQVLDLDLERERFTVACIDPPLVPAGSKELSMPYSVFL